jgi:exodeoxyribonuclease VII small subunit
MPKTKQPFEKSLNRLMEIVERLEENTVPLDEALSLYKEGLALSETCGGTLARYESEVLLLQKEAGAFSTAFFDAE